MGRDRVGPYALDRELGSGGMGTVWRAEGPEGVVALKVVHPHIAATTGFLERFLREGEVGRSVRHENVVATLGTGEDRGRRWIALEYVEGQTLHALRRALGTVPEELCRHVGREAAKGLDALHAAGLVHRDVKPENVLITKDHVVKVMDLGIARSGGDADRLTSTGTFVGSVQYASPEQFLGGGLGIDARADLWALGVTLYEISTGVQPFEGADVPETLRNVLHGTPRRAGEVNPQLSAFFEEVLRTLLEKDREKRFASASELLLALEGGERSEWWRGRSASIRQATRRPLRRMRIPRETALYGRDGEIAQLRSRFESAAAGDGRVVIVEGEAGIGKSRLVDEFVGRLESEGNDVNFLWGSYPPGGAATGSGAFSTAWREHFGGDEEHLRAALPEQPLLVPAFAALLRGDAPPKGAEPLTRESLQTVFVRSAQALSSDRVTIVLVEDLHFAPDEGRALFASLAMAVAGHRILLVGTTRPGLDGPWTANVMRAGAEKLVVPRLGAADLVKLLADSLRSVHLASDLAGQIALKSDGNPFFVFEILRALREGLFLTRRDDGTWATTRRIEEIHIPPSVAELIQARVSVLGDDDRNLLELAACVGFEFDPTLVGAVLGLPPVPVLQRFGAIEKRSRLVRSVGRSYVFDHHQIQEHMYSGISEPLREQYHAAIGDALESRGGTAHGDLAHLDGPAVVAICEHLFRGGCGTRALAYLDPALHALESSSLHRAAADLAGRALNVPGLVHGPRRMELLLRRAERLDFAGRGAEKSPMLDEACALAETASDPRLLIRALRARGWHRVNTGDYSGAESDLTAAIEGARATGDRISEAGAHGEAGTACYSAGRLDQAMMHATRQLELAEACASRSNISAAHGLFANVFQVRGESARELEHQRVAADLVDPADGRRRAIATANLGNAYLGCGRLEEARACQMQALDQARRLGDRRAEMNAVANLASIESRSDPPRAVELYGRALGLAAELGARRTACIIQMNLANSLLELGRIAECVSVHESSCGTARELGESYLVAYTFGNHGGALLAIGRPAEALGSLDAAIEAAKLLGNDGLRAMFTRQRSEALEELGEAANADAELDQAILALASAGLSLQAGSALVLRADRRSRRGEGGPARADLDECLRHFREQSYDVGIICAEVLRVRLGCGSASESVGRLQEAGDRIGLAARIEAWNWMWQATRDPAHLAEAKRLLDDLLSKNPPEHHDSMLRNVRVHREITDAWAVYGGDCAGS